MVETSVLTVAGGGDCVPRAGSQAIMETNDAIAIMRIVFFARTVFLLNAADRVFCSTLRRYVLLTFAQARLSLNLAIEPGQPKGSKDYFQTANSRHEKSLKLFSRAACLT